VVMILASPIVIAEEVIGWNNDLEFICIFRSFIPSGISGFLIFFFFDPSVQKLGFNKEESEIE